VKKKIIIIGGGVTGLSTAYFLKEKSRELGIEINCTLIEASDRLGGKIVTDRIGDFIIEGGPDSFLSQKPWGITLCRKLGLMDQLVSTHPVHKAIYILSHGRLKPFPEGMNLMIPCRITPFLLSPIVSWQGKARMGLDLLIPKNKEATDESIASFVRRRLGSEAVATFAEPILATIYAGDVEQLSLAATFPQFAGLEKEFGSLIWGIWMKKWDARMAQSKSPSKSMETGSEKHTLFITLKNGLASLVQSLQEQLLGIDIQQGQAVKAIFPHQGGYAIDLSNKRLDADAVVITTDATTAAHFIGPWDEVLSGHLASIPYVSTATVSLGFRRTDIAHPLTGFGFVVPRLERGRILATTWSSTKFHGRAHPADVLIRSFLGGAHQEEVVDLSDDELVSAVYNELRPVLGISAKPTMAHVFKWRKANPQYNMGHLTRVAAIYKEADKHAGLFLAGAAYKGVGIPDCIQQGWEAAEKVLSFVQKGA
jgi:oxygen-dependent protoporphyrinogen oxidase